MPKKKNFMVRAKYLDYRGQEYVPLWVIKRKRKKMAVNMLLPKRNTIAKPVERCRMNKEFKNLWIFNEKSEFNHGLLSVSMMVDVMKAGNMVEQLGFNKYYCLNSLRAFADSMDEATELIEFRPAVEKMLINDHNMMTPARHILIQDPDCIKRWGLVDKAVIKKEFKHFKGSHIEYLNLILSRLSKSNKRL